MDYTKIIIGVGLFFGIIYFKKTNPNYLKLIVIGFIISFSISLFEIGRLKSLGFYLFGLMSLLYSVHCVVKMKWNKIVISFFAFFTFLAMYFQFPFSNERKIALIIPVVLALFLIKNIKKNENEIAIIFILSSYQCKELLSIFF
jgi:hypothetical protein